MGLLDILTQAMGANNQPNPNAFNQVAQQAPNDVLAQGLGAAFRSDQTPSIGNMVGQLFGQSNGAQQAGMLNSLVASLGPAAAAALAGGALSKVLQPGQTQLTADQAAKLSPDQVTAIVDQAHATNPGVTDQLAGFYAEHKSLINTLGGVAASIAMMKMKDHLNNNNG